MDIKTILIHIAAAVAFVAGVSAALYFVLTYIADNILTR